jgi:hypothetical protein
MWAVNALPNGTLAELYDLQSERSQAVALLDGVLVGERKWRNSVCRAT